MPKAVVVVMAVIAFALVVVSLTSVGFVFWHGLHHNVN